MFERLSQLLTLPQVTAENTAALKAHTEALASHTASNAELLHEVVGLKELILSSNGTVMNAIHRAEVIQQGLRVIMDELKALTDAVAAQVDRDNKAAAKIAQLVADKAALTQQVTDLQALLAAVPDLTSQITAGVATVDGALASAGP